MTLTKPIANQIAKDRLYQWRKRNEATDEICVPVVLISIVQGNGKSGISLNITQDSPLPKILEVLQIAVKQVQDIVKTT